MTHVPGKYRSSETYTAILSSAAPGREERGKVPFSLSPTFQYPARASVGE